MTLPASVRLGAAGAAAVLAGLSQGDLLVLAAALVLVVWRPLPAIGVALALAACAGRWSSAALVDVAGAQAVLGPAGTVEPVTLAASAWLGALALVAASPCSRPRTAVEASAPVAAQQPPAGRRRVLRAEAEPPAATGRSGVALAQLVAPVALGLAAAVVVAGPAPGGALWARALAAVTAGALALAVGRWRERARAVRLLDLISAAAGGAALLLVLGEQRPWSGTLGLRAALEGAAIVVSVGLAVVVVVTGLGAMERRRI